MASRVMGNFLALSGGGSDGAFGAGVLAGWTASGKRPEFDIVTGVSTGALTAGPATMTP
jgi:predicted acylesterase/phospholipase RssA